MSVVGAIMVPHPPMILPGVGKGSEKTIQSTIDAYRKAAAAVVSHHPDTIILSSPHTIMYADYFHVSPGSHASGSFAEFGSPETAVETEYDKEFVSLFCEKAFNAEIPAGTSGARKPELDHGTMIPLIFINESYADAGLAPDYRLVRIGLSGLPFREHYRVGQLLKETAEELNRRTVYVASGDLSHKLREGGPYGLSPEGPEYDRRIMDVMGHGDFKELLRFTETFCDKAAECGHRSFIMMAGALDRCSVNTECLVHEDVTGVGYGVCTYKVTGTDDSRDFLTQFDNENAAEREAEREKEDAFLRLARASVEHYVTTGSVLNMPDNLPDELINMRAGAFVSLHKDGQLRGCIGTTGPTEDTLAQEIIRNAVSAASCDPRFYPVQKNELDSLEYSVDVLNPTESIDTEAELDPAVYGVIVKNGHRRGLLLPNLDGVDTVSEQISIAKRKAGIGVEEPVSLERFTVTRHSVKPH